MNPSGSPEVLIVGAGPVGLALAAFLTKAQVRFRIIDRGKARSIQSKALGVHAGTLEMIERILGPAWARRMVERGCPVREAWIHLDDLPPVAIQLGLIPSEFNYVLILPQSETERTLEEFLEENHLRVERETELLDLTQQGESVIASIRLPSGEVERMTTSFVVGCDGAHSQVRSSVGIPFEGGSYTGQFFLGDVQLRGSLADGRAHEMASPEGAMACFPMKEPGMVRLVLIPKRRRDPSPLQGETQSSGITLEEFTGIARRLWREPLEISSPTWLTEFRIHHRLAKQFVRGRVCLAGDAAHIHSPAGGQGMNIGIQDALNLSGKLHSILRQKADIAGLRRYQNERRPVARRVIFGTGLALRLASLPENPLSRWIRRYVVPWALKRQMFQAIALKAISEVPLARGEIKRAQRARVETGRALAPQSLD